MRKELARFPWLVVSSERSHSHLLGRFLSPKRRHPMIDSEGREMVIQTIVAILSLWFAAMGLTLMGRWL
jgi:hypothetical protein